ncbi:hypothetical protein OAS55_00745 [Porticoccus sp.]|nr:hypothetical protein [Porticoccus sp.]
MVRSKSTSILKVGGLLLGFGGLLLGSSNAFSAYGYGGDNEPFYNLNMNGYVRTTVGVMLQDNDETRADDKFRMNQAEVTLNLDFDIKTGPLNWKVITRFDKEMQTDYLDDLEERMDATAAAFNIQGNYSGVGSHNRGDFMEQYETTDEVFDWLRELYFDVNLLDDRLMVRVGRQQLVWGESDFFQAMDVVHGYDYRGRLFYENNEEWRKPLMLFNFRLDFYELGGSLNWYIRPGWDRKEDMGSNYNIEGGRWIPHPYRGVDFTQFTTSYRTDHDSGDWSDMTYGIRWNGEWGSIGYSFAYMKTFNPAPVVNPYASSGVLASGEPDVSGLAVGINNGAYYGYYGLQGETETYGGDAAKTGTLLGDWMYPEIDIFGFTMTGFNSPMDATISAEIAYIPNKPYNYGSLKSDLPGWNGVIEKNTLNMMFRIDKEFKWMDSLGTHRPSLSSIQLFDTWIMNHDDKDEIVEFASFGAQKKEHTAYLTIFTLMNFHRDTINPSFVAGTDLTKGGGFAIPAVEFVYGDDWRLKVEADLWFNDGDTKKVCRATAGTGTDSSCGASGHAAQNLGAATPPNDGSPYGKGDALLGKRENSAGFMDYFAGDNQLVFKLTRQF